MTNLQYSGSNVKIVNAVAQANDILANPLFYTQIEAITQFDNSTYSGLQVANEIRDLNKTIDVRTYWWPLSRVNAKSETEINVNTAKLGRTLASVTNTLIHEMVHVTDWLTNSKWDYTHDGQSPDGQDKTAPWAIGAIAEKMVQ